MTHPVIMGGQRLCPGTFSIPSAARINPECNFVASSGQAAGFDQAFNSMESTHYYFDDYVRCGTFCSPANNSLAAHAMPMRTSERIFFVNG
jgi:hypothetical protein